MSTEKNNKPSEQEMQRLLELSADPEFISQLNSFKEAKAQELKLSYQEKISELELQIDAVREELDAKLEALGITVAKPIKRRTSKSSSRTRRTKEDTQKLLNQVKELVKQHPGITAGEISEQIGESASPLLSRLKSEGLVKPNGKGRGTVWNLS